MEATKSNKNLTFEDVSGPYVRLFRIMGLLPFKGKNSNYLGTRILFYYFIFMNFMLWFPFVCYFFNESELHIDTVCETLLVINMSSRYCLLVWKRKKVSKLLKTMKSIWDRCDEEGQQIVMKFERRMRRFQHFYLCIIATVNILYPINALIIRLPPLEPNGTERRFLPYKWFTENIEESWPGYWAIFAMQFIVVQTSIVHVYLVGTALGGFIMITTGYFGYLKNKLLCTINLDDSDEIFANREIVCLIKFHQKILIFSRKFDKMSQTIFLVQVVMTCYNVSLMGFKLASSDPDRSKYLSILLGSVFQLFLCQWPPDCLFDESKEIGQAAYAVSIEWMRNRSHGKSVMLMILRAQRPVQITAGGIVPLSLQTFGSMMTNAYSFFTMLRRFDL